MSENIKTRVVLDDHKGVSLGGSLLELADYLDSVLSKDWDIYVQPYLNGLQPDIVLLSNTGGMHIIECKLEASIALRRLALIQEDINDLYCPRAFINTREQNYKPAVHYSYADITRTMTEIEDEINESGIGIKNFSLIASDYKTVPNDKLLPLTNLAKKLHFNSHYAEDLRAWLRSSDYKISSSLPLPALDARQLELVNRDTPKFLKICGSAGSGKTLILAAKAAKFLMEGKRVLVLTYNITLVNYIRNLIHQNLNQEDSNKRGLSHTYSITWFHRFAKTQLVNLGWGGDYSNLWQQDEIRTNEILDNSVAALLKRLTEEENVPENHKFDAILIDEGQDTLPGWWDGVKPFLSEDGNACFIYDFRQDVYNRVGKWQEKKFSLSGFLGRPNELKTAYRLPNTYIPKIKKFIEMFLQNQNDIQGDFEDLIFNLPEPSKQVDMLEQCSTSWIQVDDDACNDKCLEAILDYSKLDVDDFAYSSLLFLTTSKSAGIKICNKLISQKIEVTNTFSNSRDLDRAKKAAFNLHNDPIKATHVFSGKGLESSQIILQITKKCNNSDVYTGLTRLKKGVNSQCSIIVVCSNPRFKDFAQIFNS